MASLRLILRLNLYMTKKKILLIDDDEFIRKVYSSDLTERGFEVVTAADGAEGLAKIASEQPNLIILDLIMPQKNGFEVLAALKNQDLTAKVPTIVLSNLAQEEDKDKAKSLGAVDYLIKDQTTFDIMAAAVERALQQP